MVEDEEPEFPPELDEYLEYCMSEHNGDFEAISREFLDIAADLEEPMVTRAHEFFSPEGLRKRWYFLTGQELPAQDDFPFQQRPLATESNNGCQAAGAAAASAVGAASHEAAGHAPLETVYGSNDAAPSDFSIFRNDLKTEIDRIYLDVQTQLPSTVAEPGEESDDSDFSGTSGETPFPLRMGAPPTAAAAPVTAGRAPMPMHDESEDSEDQGPVAAASPSRMGEASFASTSAAATAATSAGKEAAAPLSSGGALAAFTVQAKEPSTEAAGDDLRQKAQQLFGTDDMSHIIPDMAEKSGLSQDIPNFDVVLLSHGVNPHDIEGPLVQPPEHIKSLFDGSRGHSDDDAGNAVATAVPVRAARENRANATHTAQLKQTQQQQQQQQKEQQKEQLKQQQQRQREQWEQQQARLHARPQSADRTPNGDEESDESGEEDLAQLRRTMKNTSNVSASKDGEAPSPKRVVVAPRSKPKGSPASTPQNKRFVKLELVESSDAGSSEAEEGEEAEGNTSKGGISDSSEESEDEANPELDSVKVMRKLLRKAPNGVCQWDTWLEATRKWPRLQLRLGSPEFMRKDDGGLQVTFNAEKMKVLLEEERQRQGEERATKAERAAKLKENVAFFIREAEKRREQIGGRFGGFVLTSTCPELEAEQDKQRLKREAEEEAERKKEEQARKKLERERARKEELERRKGEERKLHAEKARLLQKRADEERAERQLKAEASRRQQLLAMLATSMSRHRLPLYDPILSFSAPVPGLSPAAEEQIDGAGGEFGPLASYLLPWGVPGPSFVAPTVAQLECLSAMHTGGLAEALVLLPSRALRAAGAPELVCSHAAGVLMVVRRDEPGTEMQLESRLPCGQRISEVLVGPLFGVSLFGLLRQPLALWALDIGTESDRPADHSQQAQQQAAAGSSNVSTVCVPLRRPRPGSARSDTPGSSPGSEAVLSTLLSEVYAEGLAVAGLRLVFPRQSAQDTATSAGLKQIIRPGEPLLMVGLRGPSALEIWRAIIGPSDPELARRTDPGSLNARFGGAGRSGAVAPAPPSSVAKATSDLIWAFGGRLNADAPQLPGQPLHTVLIGTPKRYALRVCGRPAFSSAGALLSGLLLRAGRLLSVNAEPATGNLLVIAVREGGDVFVKDCRRLFSGPPDAPSDIVLSTKADDPEGVPAGDVSLVAEPCKVPSNLGFQLGFAHSAVMPLPEAYCSGDPEVLVVALKPKAVDAHGVLNFCSGIYSKFAGGVGAIGSPKAPQADAPQSSALLYKAQTHPIFDVGASVDLLSARLLDVHLCISKAEASSSGSEELQEKLQVLRQFHSFAQVLGRIPAKDCEPWYVDGPGPVVLLCLRGAGLVERFRNFMAKEWTFSGATSGDVMLSPTMEIATQAYRLFFGDLTVPSFAATVPSTDLRSDLRFRSPAATAGAMLKEASLFPRSLAPQLTVAALLPPTSHKVMFKLLTEVEQKGFHLVAAFMSGGLPENIAKCIFEQEVADEQLEPDDWKAFCGSVGCVGEDEEEDSGNFKCLWLVLAKHQAVKKLAQMCGHGDPAVNSRHLRASLRVGRNRITNGLRCPTSWATAQALLQMLTSSLSLCLGPPTVEPEECRLGVEDGPQQVECALVAIAIRRHNAEEDTVPRTMREIFWALCEQGLQCVGLRFVDKELPGMPEFPADPDATTPVRLKQWEASRPAAAGVTHLVLANEKPAVLLLMAWEGHMGIGRARQGVASAATAMPKGSVEHYVSVNSNEAAVDIVYFFHELFAAKHYVVGP